MVINLTNIQSIAEATYDFPDHGIVQIKGGNSNGKSIVIRAISCVVTMSMLDQDTRDAMIRDGYDEGMILFEYRERVLLVKLHRNRNNCLIALRREDGEIVQRAFRDTGIPELISEFGFCCFSKNSICLQLYETFGPMPFVNTRDSENNEIIVAVTEDTTAKNFLDAFKRYTHPKASEQVKQYNREIDRLNSLKSSIVLFDYEKYEDFNKKLKKLYNVIKNAKIVELEEISLLPNTGALEPISLNLEQLNIVPRFDIIDLPMVELTELPEIVQPISCTIGSLKDDLADLMLMRQGICPTCGRSLIEGR